MLVDNQSNKSEEKDNDIDLNVPDVEKAAIKIQAGFKGYKARKQLLAERDSAVQEAALESQEEDNDQDLTDPEVHRAATKIQAGFRGYHTRKQWKDQMKNEADENNIDDANDDDLENMDLKDPDLSQAALKIQAGFRGLQSRKELQRKKELRQQEEFQEHKDDEAIDIDLTDPDVEKAALKLQAGFKGLKARKNLQKKTEERLQDVVVPAKTIDHELDAHQADLAALKIQAGYRGYVTRKTLKEVSGQQAPETAPDDSQECDDGKHEQKADGDEEEVDIDLTDPEVEKATIKLQAGFKGFMARKQMLAQAVVAPVEESQGHDSEQGEGRDELHEMSAEDADEDVQRKALEEFERDPHELRREKAAMKIQAGYRGMKTRREVKVIRGNGKEVDETEEAVEEVENLFEEESDEM